MTSARLEYVDESFETHPLLESYPRCVKESPMRSICALPPPPRDEDEEEEAPPSKKLSLNLLAKKYPVIDASAAKTAATRLFRRDFFDEEDVVVVVVVVVIVDFASAAILLSKRCDFYVCVCVCVYQRVYFVRIGVHQNNLQDLTLQKNRPQRITNSPKVE